MSHLSRANLLSERCPTSRQPSTDLPTISRRRGKTTDGGQQHVRGRASRSSSDRLQRRVQLVSVHESDPRDERRNSYRLHLIFNGDFVAPAAWLIAESEIVCEALMNDFVAEASHRSLLRKLEELHSSLCLFQCRTAPPTNSCLTYRPRTALDQRPNRQLRFISGSS